MKNAYLNKCFALQLLALIILVYQPFRISACGAPPAKIIGSKNVCQYRQAIYKSSETGYKSYKWVVKNASINFGQESEAVHISWDTSANIELTLIVEDFSNCKDSVNLTVKINKPFQADAGPDYKVCPFTKVKIGPTTPLSNKTYVWYDLRLPNKGPIYTEANPVINAIPNLFRDITIPFKVVISDTTTGCSVTDTVNFTTYRLARPQIKASENTIQKHCFIDTGEYYVDSMPATGFWLAKGGKILGDNTGEKVKVNWNNAYTDTLMVVYKTLHCGNDTGKFIVSTDTITPRQIMGYKDICFNEVFKYYIYPSGAIIKWSVNGGEIVSSPASNEIYVKWDPNASQHKIDVILISRLNSYCSFSSSFEVKPIPSPIAAFSVLINGSKCIRKPVVFAPEKHTYDKYLWKFGDGTVSTDVIAEHSYAYKDRYNVKLTVYNAQGCHETSTQLLEIDNAGLVESGIYSSKDYPKVGDTISYYIMPNPNATVRWGITGGEIISNDNKGKIKARWTKTGQGKIWAFQQLNDCTGDTMWYFQNVEAPNSLPGIDSKIEIEIYPNPASGRLYINADEHINRLEIYNTTGAKEDINYNLSLKYADVSALSDGIYYCRIYCHEKIFIKQIIIQH